MTSNKKCQQIPNNEGQWKKALAPKDNGGLGYTRANGRIDESRHPRGGLELTQVEELAKVINPVVLTQSPDSWSWTLNNSGGYTVASSRNMIDSRLLPKGDQRLVDFDMFPQSEHLRLEGNDNSCDY
ncbi:hypothetical protein Tco_1002750 [Tanacetum coccineum]|uniref:Uncharacterized protein n=1 Tax=Tanacetum coccineum TaxID=301880 RepID=A0ABQ5F912_9ASTR